MSAPHCTLDRASKSLLASLVLAASACASRPAAPPPRPCTLPATVLLTASERINPDSNGAALPTVVRLYELKAIARVEESDFRAIWEQPKETLGADMLGVQEYTLFPGQSEQVRVALKPETRFLVGVAIFRRPTGSQWRSIIPLPESPRLCRAYAKKGAPSPAISFVFDQYRAEGRSRLLNAGADHDLPSDVAPDRATKVEKSR